MDTNVESELRIVGGPLLGTMRYIHLARMNTLRPHKACMRLEMAGPVQIQVPIIVVDEFAQKIRLLTVMACSPDHLRYPARVCIRDVDP